MYLQKNQIFSKSCIVKKTNNPFFFFFLFLLFPQNTVDAQPPVCDRDTAEMTPTCETACIVCDIDGFNGSHLGSDGGVLPDGFCTNTVHNARWIAFQAGSENLRIEVTALDCRLNNDSGLEMGIYKEDNCSNFQLVSECFGAGDAIRPDETKIFTTTEPLVIGQHYYIAMDGARGDNCDWLFSVLEGSTAIPEITNTPEISGPSVFGCNSPEQRFSIPSLRGAVFYDWILDGIPQSSQSSFIDLTDFVVGEHEICVTPRNVCTDGDQVCFTFEIVNSPVGAPQEITGEPSFCDSEIGLFSIPIVEGASRYEWTIDNAFEFTTQEVIELTGIESGEHLLCVTPKNDCENGEERCISIFVSESDVVQRQRVLCIDECYTEDGQLICEFGTFSYSIPNLDDCDTIIEITLIEEEERLVFPTAISPNGNNMNDSFHVLGGLECSDSTINQYELNVYDRWGNIVFSSFNPDESWEGNSVNNNPLFGTFIYHVVFTVNDSTLEQAGTITVIR